MRMELSANAVAEEDFARIARIVTKRLHANGYAGWDPFDGLNSQLFASTPLKAWPLARLCWTQLFKRLPVNMRKVALVTKSANPVTIALAAEIKRRQGDDKGAFELVEKLLAMATASKDPAAFGWGYPFPWQAKAFYVERHEPNIIATAYSLRELANWQHQLAAQDAIIRACAHIAKQFSRRAAGRGRYIAYVERSDAVVHNANLWGAHSLALGGAIANNSAWLELAQDAAQFSLAAQRADGSWAYGEASHHQFTDGFHTGYVLEALQRMAHILPGLAAKTQIKSGFDFYLNNLLEGDGTAKYYAENRFPIDANAAAQAIITLDILQAPDDRRDVTFRIMQAAIKNLWLEERGYFAYQRSAGFINCIEYPRWTQIWMALALQIVAELPRMERPHHGVSLATVETPL
jgi:polysaccharide biosynthesis protein VpsJ